METILTFKDHKVIIGPEQPFVIIGERINPTRRKKLAESMAQIVAWGQLRSGGRNGSAIADELIAFGEKSALRSPLLEYARQYAGQVLTDYESFSEAFEAGKLA